MKRHNYNTEILIFQGVRTSNSAGENLTFVLTCLYAIFKLNNNEL